MAVTCQWITARVAAPVNVSRAVADLPGAAATASGEVARAGLAGEPAVVEATGARVMSLSTFTVTPPQVSACPP